VEPEARHWNEELTLPTSHTSLFPDHYFCIVAVVAAAAAVVNDKDIVAFKTGHKVSI